MCVYIKKMLHLSLLFTLKLQIRTKVDIRKADIKTQHLVSKGSTQQDIPSWKMVPPNCCVRTDVPREKDDTA